MTSILIKNGRVVTADGDYQADLLTEGEHILAIGAGLPEDGVDRVIDASGKLVMPGGIDPHVHLDMPFMGTSSADDYTSGTTAALHGGTTTVIDFVLQTQGKSIGNALDTWRGKSEGKACCDYSYHIAVTDVNPDTLAEIGPLILEQGLPSFKVFMAYKGALQLDDRQMTELMFEVKKHGGIINVHATNGDVIDGLVAKHLAEGKTSPLYHYLSQPEVTEAEASGRFADLCNYTGVPGYIVHMTCQGALEQVRRAGYRNQKVFAETCIQYLLLDASRYQREDGAKWVMSPPLREPKDQDALWAGIDQGLIQVVATDHCPFSWKQKQMGQDDFSKIPNGHPAIEHRLELLFSEGVRKGRISLHKFVDLVATNPAKIFGLFPRKGTLAVGTDADIVVFDPERKHTISAETHHMNVDYSAYEGWEVTGKADTVILRGEVVVEQGEAMVSPGYGQFVRRGRHAGVV